MEKGKSEKGESRMKVVKRRQTETSEILSSGEQYQHISTDNLVNSSHHLLFHHSHWWFLSSPIPLFITTAHHHRHLAFNCKCTPIIDCINRKLFLSQVGQSNQLPPKKRVYFTSSHLKPIYCQNCFITKKEEKIKTKTKLNSTSNVVVSQKVRSNFSMPTKNG